MAQNALPEAEHQDVLARAIIPASTSRAVTQEHPVVVLVAGPPGSGKTRLGDLLHPLLGLRGGAVRVGSDLYKAAHRHYEALLDQDVRTAGVLVRPDTRRWQSLVEEHVRAHRLDALVETALADPDEARAQAAAYREAGHRIEVVALACALAWSQLGVLERYLGAGEGAGRFVSWANHDQCARQLAHTLDVLENERLVDRVTVVRRGLELLYGNELINGIWVRPPAAGTAVETERGRWWGAVETRQFRRALTRTERSLVRAENRVPADRLLAVSRDAERTAALAEPVRRIAQARTGAPGVDYHRLSPTEHRWVFEELIAPGLLSGAVPQPGPVAVFLVAPVGTDTTVLSRLVRRAMRPGTARLADDDLNTAHPDYLALIQTDPREAAKTIRADCAVWFDQACALLRERRCDALIRTAPADAGTVLHSTAAFRAAGYRVEVTVQAARGCDSRQDAALRYARALEIDIPAPFASAACQDVSFAAVEEVTAALGHPQAAAVRVVDRAGRLLGAGAGAFATLVAERTRPYVPQEALRFVALQRALRKALPRHRAELDAVSAQAWPLLPEGMRAAQVGRPRARALPAVRPAGQPVSFCNRPA
ncbi:zeta toxin family protein [Kitasatospora sp. NPDC094016]|uniref:zeta toxin family protein n=1 Tax=Kitasatospora sp. NPDC094016 TaxID=3154986 RepID=UPI0033277D7D